MSGINKRKCDRCGKETAKKFEEPRWISIDGRSNSPFTVGVFVGQDRIGRSQYVRRDLKDLDFCSIQCVTEWFESMEQEALT